MIYNLIFIAAALVFAFGMPIFAAIVAKYAKLDEECNNLI